MHCSNEDGAHEHVVVVNASDPYDPTPVLREDKIMFEEVPLSSLIECVEASFMSKIHLDVLIRSASRKSFVEGCVDINVDINSLVPVSWLY